MDKQCDPREVSVQQLLQTLLHRQQGADLKQAFLRSVQDREQEFERERQDALLSRRALLFLLQVIKTNLSCMCLY
jgi:hypothetical protein